jgi:hypothetical protein
MCSAQRQAAEGNSSGRALATAELQCLISQQVQPRSITKHLKNIMQYHIAGSANHNRRLQRKADL